MSEPPAEWCTSHTLVMCGEIRFVKRHTTGDQSTLYPDRPVAGTPPVVWLFEPADTGAKGIEMTTFRRLQMDDDLGLGIE